MKLIYVFVCLLFCAVTASFNTAFGQCEGFSGKITFSDISAEGHTLIETSDGGILLAGYGSGLGIGGEDWVLIKLDADLNEEWSTAIGYSNTDEEGRDLVLAELNSGQYVLGGFRIDGFRKAHVLLFSNTGALIWSKQIADHYSVPRAVKAQPDGGFVVVGTINVPTGASEDAYIEKYNTAGDILWSHRLDSGTGNDHFYGLSDTPTGNIAIIGSSVGFSGNHSGMLVEIEPDGTIVGQHTYHEGSLTQFLCLNRTNDNHYLIGAHQLAGNVSKGIVIKLAPDYSIDWQLKIHQGQRNYISDVYRLSSGDVIAYYVIDNDNNDTDSFGIVRIDYETGEVLDVINADLQFTHRPTTVSKGMHILDNDAILTIGESNGNLSLIGFDSCLNFGCQENDEYTVETANFSKVDYTMPVYTLPVAIDASPSTFSITDNVPETSCLECTEVAEVSSSIACEGVSSQLEALLNDNATSVAAANWNFPGHGDFTGQQINLTLNESGNFPYTVEVLSASGCEYSLSGEIIVVEASPPPILPDELFWCETEESSIDLSEWQSVFDISDTEGNSITEELYVFDNAGNYNFTFQNDCNSYMSEVLLINVFENLELLAESTICNGDLMEVTLIGWDNTFAEADFSLDFGNGEVVDFNDLTANSIYESAGLYTVTLSAESEGCAITVEHEVEVESAIQFVISPEETICPGETVDLDFSTLSFPVSGPSGNPIQSFSTSLAGTYTFTASNACGSVERQLEVNVIAFNPSPLGLRQQICPNRDTVSVGFSNQNLDVLWSTGATTPTIQTSVEGTYFAQISDNSGTCSREYSFEVANLEYNPRNVWPDETIILCEEGERTVHPAFIGVPYTFSDGSVGFNFYVEESGVIEVEYSDQCYSYQESVTVELGTCLCPLWVPNAFTPNADGLNDLFAPVADCPVYDFHLQVFDRWGRMVFESRDIDDGWNGASPNTDYYAQNSIFAYLIRYNQKLDGVDVPGELKGHISLFR